MPQRLAAYQKARNRRKAEAWMKYDIVFVTYNSAKWLEGCVAAIANAAYPLRELRLIFKDNGSHDDTLQRLAQLQARYLEFGEFCILPTGKNVGFGAACNQGAAYGDAPHVLFLNVDTAIMPDAFLQMDKAISAARSDVAAFELRQLPFETPHHIHPVTMECPNWASAAALLVKRTVFEAIGGFDTHFFMYGEDIDLSWRMRAAQHRLQYLPTAAVEHFTGEKGEAGSLFEYASIAVSELFLRYKYGSFSQMLAGHRAFFATLRRPLHFAHVRKVLLRKYLAHFVKAPHFLFWRFGHRALFRANPSDFATGRIARGSHPLFIAKETPLVSIVVRTHARADVLRQTLLCLTHQTYQNFEVIVAEDGAPTAKEMVEREFASRLCVRYFATGKPVGRSKTGNLGLAEAKGEFINFLDDDDYFYPDHIELMVAQFAQNPTADIITAGSMLCETDSHGDVACQIESGRLHPVIFERIDPLLMSKMCLLSIQSAMFRRSLFARCGGLDESVDGLEDWSMWLKYFAVATRANLRGVDIPRATSIYRAPASKALSAQRTEGYAAFKEQVLTHNSFTLTAAQLAEMHDNLLADVEGMYRAGRLEEYLQNAKR